MREAYIYVIRSANGKAYVGSTTRLRERRAEHFSALRNGTHVNRKLQNAFRKYGEAAFTFSVAEKASEERMLAREQHWIDATGAAKAGYNLCPVAGTTRGVPCSDERKAKISAANAGRRRSDATKALIRAKRALQVANVSGMHEANRGKQRPPEVRAKISAGHLGKIVSDVTRARMAAANLGKKASPETRTKMSASAKLARARRKENNDDHDAGAAAP